MKKQSSIEWLIEVLDIDTNDSATKEDINKAKEMHRKEIEQANRDGVDMLVDHKPFITAEQYYNETYGKGEQQ